jgi:hypothetical protein
MVNPGCYTAWHWRRKCINDLASSELWTKEFEFMNIIGLKHEKNYQFWHHRRCIVECSKLHELEKDFLA